MPNLHDLSRVDVLNIIAGVGEVLWFPVYFIVIYQNWKNKTCGMPLLGICAIFVQCLIYATFGPYVRPDLFPHNPYVYTGPNLTETVEQSWRVVWIWRGWLVVQGVVLWQYFLYHDHDRHPLDIPVPRKKLGSMVAWLLFGNLVLQWSFIEFYHDYNVNQSDPMFYLFMAGGFVMLAKARPNLKGLSLPVAWMKMIGTALIYLTIFLNPQGSFAQVSQFDTTGLGSSEKVQNRICAISPSGCPVPGTKCEIMERVCPGWETSSGVPANCVPEIATVLNRESQARLAARGWKVTGRDHVYSSLYGEFDLLRSAAAKGESPTWCPLPTSWSVIAYVDGEVRWHYQFPLATSVAGVGLDCLFIYLVWSGRRRLRAQTANA